MMLMMMMMTMMMGTSLMIGAKAKVNLAIEREQSAS